jgi:hypothetical protein
MGLSKKQREQLAKAKKRHDQRPTPRNLAPAGTRAMKRMARDHGDVLQNIEFVLVSAYREDPAFDDEAALATLCAAGLGETQSDDPRVDRALQTWRTIRETREDLTDALWLEGLRVVIDSVRLHSTLRAGDTSYLDFVSEFIA